MNQEYSGQNAEQPEPKQPERREFETTAEELRATAEFLQESLDAVLSYSDIEQPLQFGDLKEFPRPSSEFQAALQGLTVLQQWTAESIAALLALAAVLDDGREVPPGLLTFVQLQVEAFRSRDRASAEAAQ